MHQAELTALFCARPQAFAWLIGAGASRMSGRPTANDIIQDLKARYYCQQEGEDILHQDMQNDAVRTRIQSFMDARGFPAQGADEEYTAYFEKIFGMDKERQRKYLRGILSEDRVRLTVGNRVLAAMLSSGLSRTVFTTNFDSVVERAFAEISGRSLTAFHLEGSVAAVQALNNEEYPLYAKLHGDFRYDSIKNLSVDLAHQDQQLALCLKAAATRFGLIVAGYSGRDESVMALLDEALDQPNAFPAGLFWTRIKGASVLPAVDGLIARARDRGIIADLVDIETFDTLMLRLWRNIADRPAELDAKVHKSISATVNIQLAAPGTQRPLLRLNALPVRALPTRCLCVRTRRSFEWAELRALQKAADRRVLFTKGAEILAWGDPLELKRLFGQDFIELEERDLPTEIDGPEHLHIKGFLEEALLPALARGRPLIGRTTRDGAILIADSHATDRTSLDTVGQKVGQLTGLVAGLFAPATKERPQPEQIAWAEALRLSLLRKNGETWLVLDPDVWIWPPRARECATEFLDRRNKGRFNRRYDDLLSAWIEAILGKHKEPADLRFSTFDVDAGGESPAFVIGSRTAFAWKAVA